MDDNVDGDSDRTESYTPPSILDRTNDFNSSSEKENKDENSSPIKQHSIIVLDDTFEHIPSTEQNHNLSNNYWDQWPLIADEREDAELSQIYSIPDIDVPPSPRPTISSSNTTASNILNILTGPLSMPTSSHSPPKKATRKRKKKKKSMSEYRPPSPFSPKPDYKSMDAEHLKKYAIQYGLSATLARGRLIKTLDEIYHVTHQYETDSDYDFEMTDMAPSKKDLSHTPPTPAIHPELKKAKKRPAIHQMSSSDEIEEHLSPPAKKPSPTLDNDDPSDEEDINHEGRFLELTVHELSTTASSSSSSLSMIFTPPTHLPNSAQKKTSTDTSPQSSTTKKTKKKPSTPVLAPDSETVSTKKAPKKIKPQIPTQPLKEIVRDYIQSNPTLHARILCYEPVDFEEFYKQIKTDLNLKIVSKELMQCLDDQCITFTLRSRKGAFTSVMRAKRRK